MSAEAISAITRAHVENTHSPNVVVVSVMVHGSTNDRLALHVARQCAADGLVKLLENQIELLRV